MSGIRPINLNHVTNIATARNLYNTKMNREVTVAFLAMIFLFVSV